MSMVMKHKVILIHELFPFLFQNNLIKYIYLFMFTLKCIDNFLLYLFFACHSFNWPIQGVLIKYLGLNGLTLSSQEGNGIQLELYYSTVRIVTISIRLYIFVCN